MATACIIETQIETSDNLTEGLHFFLISTNSPFSVWACGSVFKWGPDLLNKAQ